MATLTSLVVFLAVIILLVIVLLIAKRYLVASGNVKITLNGEKEVDELLFALKCMQNA